MIKYITKCISYSEFKFYEKIMFFVCVLENDTFHDVLKVKCTESFFIFI